MSLALCSMLEFVDPAVKLRLHIHFIKDCQILFDWALVASHGLSTVRSQVSSWEPKLPFSSFTFLVWLCRPVFVLKPEFATRPIVFVLCMSSCVFCLLVVYALVTCFHCCFFHVFLPACSGIRGPCCTCFA